MLRKRKKRMLPSRKSKMMKPKKKINPLTLWWFSMMSQIKKKHLIKEILRNN